MKTKMNFIKSIAAALILTATANVNAQGDKLPLIGAISINNPVCAGSSNGEIVINISGGFPPYVLNGVQISGNQVTMANLSGGQYPINISDQSLAALTTVATLTEPEAIQFEANINDVSAFGQSDGSIDITVLNNNNVSFSWTTLENVVIVPDQEDQTNLKAGVYDLVITDNNGCIAAERFIVQTNIIFNEPNINFATPGADSNGSTEIQVYPNPSFGSVNIKSSKNIKGYTVINESGRVITTGSQDQLETLELNAGSYFVESVDVNGNTTRKHLRVIK
jgi:hypothetical protein